MAAEYQFFNKEFQSEKVYNNFIIDVFGMHVRKNESHFG
jgi:hypothetical protein